MHKCPHLNGPSVRRKRPFHPAVYVWSSWFKSHHILPYKNVGSAPVFFANNPDEKCSCLQARMLLFSGRYT